MESMIGGEVSLNLWILEFEVVKWRKNLDLGIREATHLIIPATPGTFLQNVMTSPDTSAFESLIATSRLCPLYTTSWCRVSIWRPSNHRTIDSFCRKILTRPHYGWGIFCVSAQRRGLCFPWRRAVSSERPPMEGGASWRYGIEKGGDL